MKKVKLGEIFNLQSININKVIVKAEKDKLTGKMIYEAIWEDGFKGMIPESDLLDESRYIRTGRCISLESWYAFLDLIKGKENEAQ